MLAITHKISAQTYFMVFILLVKLDFRFLRRPQSANPIARRVCAPSLLIRKVEVPDPVV
jgi:hypothetical protein